MDYKKLCEGFAPLKFKKSKKQWGAMGSSLIDSDTEEEAYKKYYEYLERNNQV
jgi:hypothetical protein